MSAEFKLVLDKQKIQAVSKAACKKALWSGLDYLAQISKRQVPLDQGPLMRSCTVDVNDDGTQGTVSYDTPYAVVQHEITWYNHQRGRKAKYLEDPVNDSGVQSAILDIMKAAASGEF